jgi:hypothetical protein
MIRRCRASWLVLALAGCSPTVDPVTPIVEPPSTVAALLHSYEDAVATRDWPAYEALHVGAPDLLAAPDDPHCLFWLRAEYWTGADPCGPRGVSFSVTAQIETDTGTDLILAADVASLDGSGTGAPNSYRLRWELVDPGAGPRIRSVQELEWARPASHVRSNVALGE